MTERERRRMLKRLAAWKVEAEYNQYGLAYLAPRILAELSARLLCKHSI